MKPGDFLLGVLDVFAILLPGALATWLVLHYIPPSALRDALSFGAEGPGGRTDPNEWVAVAAFVIASYVLGHFVFMFGSGLDTSYDHWRKRAKPTTRDATFRAANALQKSLTPNLVGGEWTTLKWARAYIEVKAQHARVEIDRLEADQKFFRSLVVIGVAFAAHFLLHAALFAGLVAIAMAALAYRRYIDRRWKMTELTYGTAVIASIVESDAAPRLAEE